MRFVYPTFTLSGLQGLATKPRKFSPDGKYLYAIAPNDKASEANRRGLETSKPKPKRKDQDGELIKELYPRHNVIQLV